MPQETAAGADESFQMALLMSFFTKVAEESQSSVCVAIGSIRRL
jgi:hypothetical protein